MCIRDSKSISSYLVPGTAVWIEIVDFVRKWMNENIPCFDPNLPHNNLNVTTRSKLFFQEIKESHLAYYGSIDNINLTSDHRMFIARELEKELISSRRTIIKK